MKVQIEFETQNREFVQALEELLKFTLVYNLKVSRPDLEWKKYVCTGSERAALLIKVMDHNGQVRSESFFWNEKIHAIKFIRDSLPDFQIGLRDCKDFVDGEMNKYGIYAM